MKILCAADLHIGRRASRLPKGVDPQLFSGAAAWERIVDLAIRKSFALVLLAGDIVDKENHYFEAYGPLEAGVSKLSKAGIAVWAVAGNHDTAALPKLADAMKESSFKLIGRGGSWERATLKHNGKNVLCVDGWSFHDRVEPNSPLSSYELPPPHDAPFIVMLHGDLDQSTSNYAPIARSDMERIDANFWLLGHIHRPSLESLNGGAKVLYPGSPLALSPAETALHGPWMMEIVNGELSRPTQIPLSQMRYENIAFDISTINSIDKFDTWIVSAIRNSAKDLLELHEEALGLSLRVSLTGRSPLHSLLPSRVHDLTQDYYQKIGNTCVSIDQMSCDTAPDYNLKELAIGTSPASLLAKLILSIEGGNHSRDLEFLIDNAATRFEDVQASKPFQNLKGATLPLTKQEVIARTRKAGLTLLDRLLAQKERA